MTDTPDRPVSRPLLFASIPPRTQGIPFSPEERGNAQTETIRSWIRAGFQPVAVTSSDEAARHPELAAALQSCGAEWCVCPRPNGPAAAAPLVPIVDLLRIMRVRAVDAPVAITNADIDFASSSGRELAARVEALADGEYLLGQRTDMSRGVEGWERLGVFAHGFDFVAFRGSWIDRIAGLLSPDLQLGRPWWDHYLPLALIAAGAETRLLHPGWFRHAVHDNRWNRRHYHQIGRAAAAHFREALRAAGDPPGSRDWRRLGEREITLPGVPPQLTGPLYRFGMRRAAPAVVATALLNRLASAHMRLILQTAWSSPAPPPPLD